MQQEKKRQVNFIMTVNVTEQMVKHLAQHRNVLVICFGTLPYIGFLLPSVPKALDLALPFAIKTDKTISNVKDHLTYRRY